MADFDDPADLSEEFHASLGRLKVKWKSALKKNKKLLLKCPNYERCQFKCGSVGGMNYHFIRCAGNAPLFKCSHCTRSYESRTGLNYHMASSHCSEPLLLDELEAHSRPIRTATIATLKPSPPQRVTPSPPQTTPTPATQAPPPSTNAKPSPIRYNHNQATPTSRKTTPTKTSALKATPPPLVEQQSQVVQPTLKPTMKPAKPKLKKVGGGAKQTKRGKGEGGKKGSNKSITIPSIEYPNEYKPYLPLWRQEMKDNKIIKCPNFEECDFKCTTVNGMKYHFVRCQKSNPPQFNCELCDKMFQCRTGLVWHLKKAHKLMDIQPTKTGGFKGTVPPQDIIEHMELEALRLGAGRGRKKGIGGKKAVGLKHGVAVLTSRMVVAGGGRRNEMMRARKKRLRKSSFPRRTTDDILQNIFVLDILIPKQSPETSKISVPKVDFLITDTVPTDIDSYGSTMISLGEEALVWQKLSDSESEGEEYNPEFRRGYKSDSSLSEDSDEDFMCSVSRKKHVKPRVAPKQARGMKRELQVEELFEEEDEEEEEEEEEEEYIPHSHRPPPLLVKREKRDVPMVIFNPLKSERRSVPALIKATKGSTSTQPSGRDDKVMAISHGLIGKPRLKERPKIQPPPELLKQEPQVRKPPPLVKKAGPNLLNQRSMKIVTVPHELVAPTHTKVESLSYHRPTNATSISKSHASPHTSLHTSSPHTSSPRISSPHTFSPHTSSPRTSSPHTSSPRTSSPRTSSPHTSSPHPSSPHSSISKPIKLTQYKFQSGGGGAAQQPSASHTPHHYYHHSANSPTQQLHPQYQHQQKAHQQHGVPIQNVSNLITPIPFIPGVPTASMQGVPTASMQMPSYATNPGGMILVQGPHGMALAQDMSQTFVTQGGQTYQLVPASPMEALPNEGSQKVSVIMDTSGGAAYVSQGDVQGYQYITQLDGPPSKTKKTRKYENSEELRKKFETARKEEQGRLTLLEEEGEEEEEEGEERKAEEIQVPGDCTPTPVLVESENQHATCTTRRGSESGTKPKSLTTTSPMVVAPLPEVHQGLSALNLDSTAWGKEEDIKIGEHSSNLKVTGDAAPFHTGAGNEGGTGIGTGLRKSVSAEELMAEKLKNYLEKEKRARKAKCLTPLEDCMPPFMTAAATQEVPALTHVLQKKKTLHRQRSGSSTSTSSSPSPTIGKSPKSPRLIVSPTLFCPSGSQSAGTVGHTPPPMVCGSKSSKPPSAGNVSDCDPSSLRSHHLQDSNGRQVVSPESSVHHHHGTPRPVAKSKEKAVVNPSPKGELRSARLTTKVGKVKEHRKTPPSLSDLFLPDNVTTLNSASGGRNYESRKTPESSAAHGARRLLEFSSSLHHTSSLRKPIAVRTAASRSDNINRPLGRNTSTSSQQQGQTSAVNALSSASVNILVTGNNNILPITLNRGDGTDSEVEQHAACAAVSQHKGNWFDRRRLSENTNNCNSNDTDDSLEPNPKPPQKQEGGQGSCDTQRTKLGEASQQHVIEPPKSNPLLGKHGKADDSREDPNPPPKRRRQQLKKSETKHSVPTSSCTQQQGDNESHLSTSQRETPSQEGSPTQHDVSSQGSPGTPPIPKKKRGRPPKGTPGKRGRPRKNAPNPPLQGIRGTGSGSSEPKPEDPHSSSPPVIVPSTACVTSESTMDDRPHVQRGKRKQGEEFPGQLGGEEQLSPVAAAPEITGASTTSATESDLNPSPQKRRRGRPQKSANKTPEVSTNVPVNSDHDCMPSPLNKRRGRPPRKQKDTSTSVTPAKVLRCEKCDNVYTTKSGLKAHLLVAHPPELGVDTPLSECVSMWRMILKTQKHISCHLCRQYRAISIPAMKYHLERCGKSAEEFAVSCPECGKVYNTKPGLQYHLKSQHTQQKQVEEPVPRKCDLFEMPDISQPLPARQAARRATDKLQEIAKQEMVAVQGQGPRIEGGSSSSPPSGILTAEVGIQATVSVAVGPSRVEGGGSEYIPPPLELMRSAKESTVVPGYTNAQVSEFRKIIGKDGSVKCPIENCTKIFKSLAGLSYHITHHAGSQRFSCPVCKRVLRSRRRLENHLKGKHPDNQIGLQDIDDLEYRPTAQEDVSDIETVEDWEAEEDEEQKKERRLPSSRSSRVASNIPIGYGEYHELVRKVCKSLWRCSGVLEEWRPRTADWVRLEKEELRSHLPPTSTSMYFTFDPPTESNTEDHCLPAFGSMETDHSGVVCFAGGPIWAMDWLPVTDPEAEQYMALAAYKEFDQAFPVDTPIVHNGLVQLWSMGQMDNKMDCLPELRLALGIAHRFGCIRDLRWCPSGVWEVEERRGEEEGLPRLGVLGLACSDGGLRVMVIPHPKSLLSSLDNQHSCTTGTSTPPPSTLPPVFVRPQNVAATLTPCGLGQSDWSSFGQCLCMDWLPGNGHTKITAGYSNGTVCVWDLLSSFLKRYTLATPLVHPLLQVAAHIGPCRCVSWCPLDGNYLFTGGHDKMMNIWDLRQPHAPRERHEKVFLRGAVWPLLYSGVFTVEDYYTSVKTNGVIYSSFLHAQFPSKFISSGNTPTAGCGYCKWTDRVVAGTFAGQVLVTDMPSTFYSVLTSKFPLFQTQQRVIYHCQLEPLARDTPSTTSPEQGGTTSEEPTQTRGANQGNSRSQILEEECSRMDGSKEKRTRVLLSEGGTSMRQLVRTHRLVWVRHPKQSQLSSSPDFIPIASVNKVLWNPNEHSCEWLVCGTNSGLVHLFRVPRRTTKPLLHAKVTK